MIVLTILPRVKIPTVPHACPTPLKLTNPLNFNNMVNQIHQRQNEDSSAPISEGEPVRYVQPLDG
jgi:hypothetical protein